MATPLAMSRTRDLRLAWQIIKYGGIAYTFHSQVGKLTMTHGPSMEPTLAYVGDVVLVDRISTFWRPYTHGEVVISENPQRVGETVCKRIMGLPGDTVSTMGGAIQVRVPAGHVWLVGDNLANSKDSRAYGPVPISLLYGRVRARVFPFSAWGPLPELPATPTAPSGAS